MQDHPILLIGGSGIVGRQTARWLRDTSPEVPLLIGGRDIDKASKAAAELGNAEGVAIDLTRADLGLGDRRISAVAIFVKESGTSSLRFAQGQGVPHVSISSGLAEIGPDVAAYMYQPDIAPVVMGAEWLVGATTVPTLHFAKDFSTIDEISIGALLDEKDGGGPAAHEDLKRLTEDMPQSLARRNGAFYWRAGDGLKGRITAVDGTEVEAEALSPFDIIGLAAATDAPTIHLDLGTRPRTPEDGMETMPTEIIIALKGKGHDGKAKTTRHAVTHPNGQMPLTGLGVSMILERVTGLDGRPAAKPGLYFPYQLLETGAYFARLERIGGRVLTL